VGNRHFPGNLSRHYFDTVDAEAVVVAAVEEAVVVVGVVIEVVDHTFNHRKHQQR